MAIKLDPEISRDEYVALFGELPTVRQAWFLAKFAKHCRARCISNVALNNFLNKLFPNLLFKQVEKVDERDPTQTYLGLEISEKSVTPRQAPPGAQAHVCECDKTTFLERARLAYAELQIAKREYMTPSALTHVELAIQAIESSIKEAQ